MIGPIILGTIALLFWFSLMLVPSVLVTFFTHKEYLIIKSSQYWMTAGVACLPSVIGLILFVALYPLFKAPGEGAIAGLWFLFIGGLMFSVSTARYAYRYPNVGEFLFWDTFKFGAWPYLIGVAVLAVVMVVALILKAFNKLP